jgi:hypothetical protein
METATATPPMEGMLAIALLKKRIGLQCSNRPKTRKIRL